MNRGLIEIDSNYQVLLITFSIPFAINLFNYLMIYSCKFKASFERHPTKTLFNISCIKKLSFSQAFITTLILFIVEIFLNEGDAFGKTFRSGGLAYNAEWVIIGNTFIPFLVELLNVRILWKKFYRWYYIDRKVRNNQPITITQLKLNEIYEEVSFDIVSRYTTVLKSMYLTAFYAPILPIGVLWCLLGLLLQYVVDKVALEGYNMYSIRYSNFILVTFFLLLLIINESYLFNV